MGEGIRTLMTRDDQARADFSRSRSDEGEPALSQPGKNRPAAAAPGSEPRLGESDRQVSEPPEPANGQGSAPDQQGAESIALEREPADAGWVIETVVSPFHCLYQDALHFHTQSRLARSESEASRLARTAFLLYVASAEALVHQAAEELGRTELRVMLADPNRPLPLLEAWSLLPAIASEANAAPRPLDAEAPPWPQFAELLLLRNLWTYPGPSSQRRAYYRSARRDGDYEPLEPHQVGGPLRPMVASEYLALPRTGLPRDPYAFRSRHLDTARGILDAAIEALDRRMGGALTRNQRHRREPVRVIHPPP